MSIRTQIAACLSAILACLPLPSTASEVQDFPNKPVRVIVPFPAGGAIDALVRALSPELTKRWKQPIIVINKPGADSAIGAAEAARAAPDGHTILATVDVTFTSNPFIHKKLPYDPLASFQPVTMMARTDYIFLANPLLPASDLKEFVALARREPGKHGFATFGSGSPPNLMYAQIMKREGVDLLPVAYAGSSPMLTAVVAGQISVSAATQASGGELVKAGRLKVLASAGPKRSPFYPNTPTAAELGMPYAVSATWYALFAPAGTPPAIAQKISADVAEILQDRKFSAEQLVAKGLEVVASTPEQFSTDLRNEINAKGELFRTLGIKPE